MKMESYEKLKSIDIKSRMCYHIDDIIKIGNFNFGHILTDEKSFKVFWFITFHTKH